MSNWRRNDPEPARQQAARDTPDPGAVMTDPAPQERRDNAEPSTASGGRGSGGATRRRPWPLLVAALVLGLLLGALASSLLSRESDGLGGHIDSSRYQAVILSNDKVYFGKISKAGSEFYELDDAFFLRETRDTAAAEPVRALLPINREIHAPDNSMVIRKDEVVLVENLAKDSPILTEIRRQKG